MNEETTDELATATVGRTVHFVTGFGCRSAIVVRQWPNGLINVKVFLDGSNDFELPTDPPLWKTSVKLNESFKENDTWHWPRFCSHIPDKKED